MEERPVVRIGSLAFGGDAIGRLASGKVIFVQGAAPGDLVRARIVAQKRSCSFAVVDAIVEEGPDRVVPPCPQAMRCGGCPWQQVRPEAQRRWKRDLIAAELVRAGLLDEAARVPQVLAGSDLGYRSRARLHVDRGVLGTMTRRSDTLVPLETCPILTPALETFARELSESVASLGRPSGQVELYVDADGRRGLHLELEQARSPRRPVVRLAQQLGVEAVTVEAGRGGTESWGRDLVERSAGMPLEFSPGVFVQANREMNSVLVSQAMALAAAGDGRFAELYAGIGNFTVHLCERWGEGLAAESDRRGARLLRRNLATRGHQIEVVCESDRRTAGRLASAPALELLLADPPRRGIRPLYPLFARRPPARVVLVSCHPMAAVRDMAQMRAIAGYRLARLALVDMFPHTDHLELVALLERAPSRSVAA